MHDRCLGDVVVAHLLEERVTEDQLDELTVAHLRRVAAGDPFALFTPADLVEEPDSRYPVRLTSDRQLETRGRRGFFPFAERHHSPSTGGSQPKLIRV
jgi:hypothetical protein